MTPVLIFPTRTYFPGTQPLGVWWRYFMRVRACGFPSSVLSLLGNCDPAGSAASGSTGLVVFWNIMVFLR
jgi:hypothetical protein